MPGKRALIIGNSEYNDANLVRLVTPTADVTALAEVLRDPAIGGFDEVTALVNQPSTTLRRTISSFFLSRRRDELLLLYFSGHGVRDDRGQLFLAVKDTEHDLLRGTAIPAAYVTEEMDNSHSRRQVLILDCCHSGAFSRGMKATLGASVGTAAAFEGTGSGRVVLTATDSTQYAWEGDRVIGQAESSVFTYYLIEGLRSGEADTDSDGHITLDELYEYVYGRVINQTPMQTPGKWSYGQQGEMVIARNPRPRLKPAQLPLDLQQTIDDPRPWVREGAVRELDRLLRGAQPGLALAAFQVLERLADDDSRRVATIATESLAAYREAHREPEPADPTAPRRPSEPEAQDARVPQPASIAGGMPGTMTQEEIEPRIAKQHPVAGAKTLSPVFPSIQAFVPRAMRGPLLPLALGWSMSRAVGWVLSEAYGWEGTDFATVWLILNAIGGLITGLALRRFVPSFQWKQIVLIILGWTVAAILGGLVSTSLSVAHDHPIEGAARGAVGGLITGLALRWTEPSMSWKQILMVTVAWAVAWTLENAVSNYLYDTLSNAVGGSIGLWAIPGAICGAMGETIGGAVMFRQLGPLVDLPSGRR